MPAPNSSSPIPKASSILVLFVMAAEAQYTVPATSVWSAMTMTSALPVRGRGYMLNTTWSPSTTLTPTTRGDSPTGGSLLSTEDLVAMVTGGIIVALAQGLAVDLAHDMDGAILVTHTNGVPGLVPTSGAVAGAREEVESVGKGGTAAPSKGIQPTSRALSRWIRPSLDRARR